MAKNYRELHAKVVARPGAPERLAALREATVAEIGLHELRRALNRSQVELAASMGSSQPAVSQFERGEDVRLSSLRRYLEGLGARLQLVALFGRHVEAADELALVGVGAAIAGVWTGTDVAAARRVEVQHGG